MTLHYLARKLGFYLVAAWAALTLNFLLPQLIPGDPAQILLGRENQAGAVSQNQVDNLRQLLGLGHGNILQRYWDYLTQLAHGDLGRSVTYFPVPVTAVIRQALPWTLALVGVATLLSFAIGIALGALAGWRRGTWIDQLVPATTFLTAIPYFWLALLLLYLFSSVWTIFPGSGGYDPNVDIGWSWAFISSAIGHAILPAGTIVLSSIGGWLLGMRNMMVTTLSDDYVVAAEAKGLAPRTLMRGYAARNAVLPSVAGFAISLGFIVSGSIVMEVVFSYPGMGFTLLQAVQNDDFPLMQGIFLIITLAVLGANLVVDLLYGFVDPRTRGDPLSVADISRPALEDEAELAIPPGGRGRFGRLRWFLRSRRLLFGLAIVLFFVIVAVVGPRLVGDPNAFSTDLLAPPSSTHWFGTTQTGQDVFTQVVVSARGTIAIGFAAGLLATVISVLLGIGGGYVGGWVDELLSMVANIFLVIPGLPLVIVVAAYVKSNGSETTIFIIALTSWAASARVLRAQTLSVRSRDYVLAARVGAERAWRIVLVEVLPNELAIIVSQFIFAVIFAILTQAGLAFLGLQSVSLQTWGNMLFFAQNTDALASGAWWWFVPPGLCIAILGAGLAFINFGLDELLNPRLRTYKELRKP